MSDTLTNESVIVDVDLDLEIPCVVFPPVDGNECNHPAVAWTLWDCPTCGRCRFGTCVDHLVYVSANAKERRWSHKRCGAPLTYVRHVSIK